MQNTMEAQNTFNSFPQFSFFRKTVFNQVPYKNVTAREIHQVITGRYFKEATLQLREITDKEKAKKFKQVKFDFACFSGTFDRKNEKGLIKHSGLICLDFDDQPNKEKLRELLLADPHLSTVLLFTSPSGTGLKWIVKIDLNQGTHLENFLAIENYIFELYQAKIDSSGKDVARPCFLPYDPECYINYSPELKDFDIKEWLPLKSTIAPKPQQKPIPQPTTAHRKQKTFDEIVNEIQIRQIDITGNYDQWRKIGFGIASEFGISGRACFHQISRFHSEYKEDECDKQYSAFLNHSGHGATLKSFFHFAKEAGIEINHREPGTNQ